MGSPTGQLVVRSHTGTKTYEWNGRVEDREDARAAFLDVMETGGYLAVVHDEPGKSHQVRTFDEVLDVEKERGVVSAHISPALVGG
jgi:hypothetical protein